MGLVSHANVYNTCLRILSNRGFAMHVEGELDIRHRAQSRKIER